MAEGGSECCWAGLISGLFCKVGGLGEGGDASGRDTPLTIVPPVASCRHSTFSLLLFE